MVPFHNLNDKRIFDVNKDKTVIEIVQKGCLTRITANSDKTLNIEDTKSSIDLLHNQK